MKQTTNVTEKTTIQPWYFTLLRIVLGLILIWKGIVFVRDTSHLQELIQQTGVGVFSKNASILSFIITYLTLLCGIFIGSGLFTRTSSIVQIPIVIVAIIFVNIKFEPRTSELILSIITLILLVLFAIKGSGQLSADEFFRSYYKAGGETGHTKRLFQQEE